MPFLVFWSSCVNACFPLSGSQYSEDLCVFDSDSNSHFTSPACKFMAKKCLNNQQFHFLHIGSCQDGPQLEWRLERTTLSFNSTKREPCGYDTCYDWEKCSGKCQRWPHTRNALPYTSTQLVYLIYIHTLSLKMNLALIRNHFILL